MSQVFATLERGKKLEGDGTSYGCAGPVSLEVGPVDHTKKRIGFQSVENIGNYDQIMNLGKALVQDSGYDIALGVPAPKEYRLTDLDSPVELWIFQAPKGTSQSGAVAINNIGTLISRQKVALEAFGRE